MPPRSSAASRNPPSRSSSPTAAALSPSSRASRPTTRHCACANWWRSCWRVGWQLNLEAVPGPESWQPDFRAHGAIPAHLLRGPHSATQLPFPKLRVRRAASAVLQPMPHHPGRWSGRAEMTKNTGRETSGMPAAPRVPAPWRGPARHPAAAGSCGRRGGRSRRGIFVRRSSLSYHKPLMIERQH